MSVEDLIPEEEMVVTVTRGGYVKRTRSDNYRSQHRGGKGVKGAQLRADDVVEHFFVTTTHHWLLFFTNMGRVYRAKAYEIQEGGRDAKGQHVANLLEMQPDEQIAEILDIRDYEVAKYLVLATRDGLVKKTDLTAYDTNRSRGVIAINLREGDELVSAMLADEHDEILLVSKKGMSLRFEATDEALRPMGRSTSGVKGMSFRGGDSLLEASVVAHSNGADRRAPKRVPSRDAAATRQRAEAQPSDTYVFVVTEGGYAKRTARRGVPQAAARRTRHQGRQAQRGPRRPRGRAHRRPAATRCLWFLPAARWYALTSPRFPPRAGTRWASCSRSSRTTTGSSPSRRIPNGISWRRPQSPKRPSPRERSNRL